MNRLLKQRLGVARFLGLCIVLSLMAGSCSTTRPTSASLSGNPQVQMQSVMPSTPLKPTRIAQAVVPKGEYHFVQKGDTLWEISRKYDVPVNRIVDANNIRNQNRISEGQRLYIPGVASSTQEIREIPLFPDYGKWSHIVIHHTATKKGDLDSIDLLHKRRGFGELGYHFLIDNGTNGKLDGEIEVGTRWITQKNGAHTRASNMNEYGIGISLIGNFSKQRHVSDNQMHSLVYLTTLLQKHYGIPLSRVLGHKQVRGAATECPGNNFPWRRFKRLLREANLT